MAEEQEVIETQLPEGAIASDDFLAFLGESPVEIGEEQPSQVEAKNEEKSTEDPEAWKQYNEEALVASIEKGENVTDDQINFLKAKGYDVKIEGEQPEDAKAEDDTEGKTTEIPEALVEALSSVPALADKKFETAEEAIEATVQYIEQTQAAQNELVGLMNKNPALIKLIQDLGTGVNLGDSIKAHFPELFEVGELEPGDEGYKEYIEQMTIKRLQREDQIKKEEEAKVRKIQNMEKSAKDAASIAKKYNLSESDSKEFFANLNSAVAEMGEGYLSAKFMETYIKGLRFERELADAERRGEVKGANRKIILSRKDRKDDGIRRVKVHTPSPIKSQVVYANESAKKLDEFLGGR